MNNSEIKNLSVIEFLQSSENENANYKSDVLEFNKKLKEEQRAFGYTIKMLLTFKEFLPKGHATMLRKAKKDQAVYEFLRTNVRITKNGGFNAFYLRQLLHQIASGSLQKKLSKTIESVEVKKNEESAVKAA